MKSLILVLGFTFALPVFAETSTTCISIPSQNLCARATFTNAPVANVDSPFQLSFFRNNADGSVQDGTVSPTEGFEVDLFMPAMGHGSSPVRIQGLPDPGTYLVRDVFFVMSGDWQIRLHFSHETILIPITVP